MARSVSYAVLGVVAAFVAQWGWLNVTFAEVPRHPDEPGPAVGAIALVLALLFVAVGGLIVRRQPRNSVGWVQTFIDHRFYRRKYDAVQTVDGFSARLREEVDLDSLSRELVGVVTATMQPAYASLWLRSREVGG